MVPFMSVKVRQTFLTNLLARSRAMAEALGRPVFSSPVIIISCSGAHPWLR
jgi:hypothetical protein